MTNVTRRTFLLSTAALSVGCVGGAPLRTSQRSEAQTRLPALGQSWQYSKHDAITGVKIDAETYRVAAVEPAIEITAHYEMRQEPLSDTPSSSSNWLQPFGSPRDRTGTLPSEVQEPWGMVLLDPHWSESVAYEQALPLWPMDLRPGWSARINTRYKTQRERGPLPWQLTIKAHDWETISVPAGMFKALRYTNLINFQNSDFALTNSQRRETLWFAPQVGRWVARESSGTYYHEDSVADQQFREDNFRWELVNWS